MSFPCWAGMSLAAVLSATQSAPPASRSSAVPKASYFVPSAITTDDLHAFASRLELAPPQVMLSERAYDEYTAAWNADLAQHHGELEALALQVGAMSMHGASAEMANAVSALRNSERQLATRLIAHDARLFANLSEVLADVQREDLFQVQAARSRVVGRAQPFFLPGARVDLCDLLRETAVSEEVLLKAQPTLEEYDLKIAPLLLDLRDTRWRDAARIEQITAEIAEASRRRDSAAIDSLLANRSRILKSLTLLERRVAEQNNAFADNIQALLPQPYSERWRSAYDAMAYPQLLPDEGDPSQLLTELANAAGLDEEGLAAVRNVFETYRASKDSINRRMKTAQDEANDAFASTLTSDALGAANEKIEELRQKRRALHRTVLDQTTGILPKAVVERHARELTIARAVGGAWQSLSASHAKNGTALLESSGLSGATPAVTNGAVPQ